MFSLLKKDMVDGMFLANAQVKSKISACVEHVKIKIAPNILVLNITQVNDHR